MVEPRTSTAGLGKYKDFLGHWGIVGPAGLPVLRALAGQEDQR